MKKIITLTKMFALAVLLVIFTTASASFGGDEKCKTKCCKDKKNKEVTITLAELEKALDKFEVEFKTTTAVMIRTEIRQSLAKLRTIKVRPVQVLSFAPAPEETSTVEAKYRINFNDLNKEMDKVQEDMTTSPDVSQKIDFCNLEKEMDEAQKQLSRMDDIKS